MSVRRTPLKLGPPSNLGSPMSSKMFRSQVVFYSPIAAASSIGNAGINCSFDPLSVSYEFNQGPDSIANFFSSSFGLKNSFSFLLCVY